jgi:hypothetical protein
MNHAEAVSRKTDLVALADFGARTDRRWLVREALLAMRRDGLMTPALSSLVPTAVIADAELYAAEALHRDQRWIVSEAFDALRLESFGFPALAVDSLTRLTLGQIDCAWVILLQRPGEDRTMGGIDVRAELVRLGWAGQLTAVRLPFVDLDLAEEVYGLDGFACFLDSLLLDAETEELSSEPSPHDAWEGTATLPLKPYAGYRAMSHRLRVVGG